MYRTTVDMNMCSTTFMGRISPPPDLRGAKPRARAAVESDHIWTIVAVVHIDQLSL